MDEANLIEYEDSCDCPNCLPLLAEAEFARKSREIQAREVMRRERAKCRNSRCARTGCDCNY